MTSSRSSSKQQSKDKKSALQSPSDGEIDPTLSGVEKPQKSINT